MHHALIRTHHITSRKKVATLKAAAKKLGCSALLRSGGTPGIMYVRAEEEEAVRDWVGVVHGLRYKDYHLVAAPAAIEPTPAKPGPHSTSSAAKNADNTWSFEEIDTVKEFGKQMEEKGVLEWWRKAIDFRS